MSKPVKNNILLKRISNVILDTRAFVSRRVNYAQIISNWMVGRMIVEDEQDGKYTAEYGKQVIKYLSDNLTGEFGNGYNQTNLRHFRNFYLTYPIQHAASAEFKHRNQHAVSDRLERQKLISTETKSFYIDLVFYNYLLKCFVLIDLKTEELTHQDIGQMDMYVRLFEDKYKPKDDNPTIGLILCTYADKTIVKYSVMHESKQIFATKYKLYLPTEKELKREIENSKLIYKLNK